METSVLHGLTSLMTEQLGAKSDVDCLDCTLTSLGVASLAIIKLVSQCELEFDVELDDDIIDLFFGGTVRQIAEAISAALIAT